MSSFNECTSGELGWPKLQKEHFGTLGNHTEKSAIFLQNSIVQKSQLIVDNR